MRTVSGSAGFSDNDSTEGSALAMLSSSGHSRPGGGTGPSSLGQKYGNHISADSLQPSMEAPFSDAVQNASNIHSSSGVIQAHVQVCMQMHILLKSNARIFHAYMYMHLYTYLLHMLDSKL
jgi:hypothetical protein